VDEQKIRQRASLCALKTLVGYDMKKPVPFIYKGSLVEQKEEGNLKREVVNL